MEKYTSDEKRVQTEFNISFMQKIAGLRVEHGATLHSNPELVRTELAQHQRHEFHKQVTPLLTLWKEAFRGISVVAGADDLEKLDDLESLIVDDDDLRPLPPPNVVLQEGERESFNLSTLCDT